MLATSLVVLLAVYLLGLRRAWRSAGYGRGIQRGEALAFVSGWIAIAVALSSFMDEAADTWLFAHMVQHELLMVVAAPLVAAGAPLIALLWAVPGGFRRRGLESVRRPPMILAWSFLTAPAVVFVLHALALWIWHLPALYDYAIDHEGVHAVQHLCFFGTAALFWWGIGHNRYGRHGYGAAVIYVFATAMHGGLLGALLTLSPQVWYAPYLAPKPAGPTPLEDQQLAGLLMWIPAGVVLAGLGLIRFAAWLRESDRRTRFNPTPGVRRTP
jgi:putative membrane protein